MTGRTELVDRCADELIRRLPAVLHPPRATYRLQFRKDRLTFGQAAELVPYLARLGVSHVYASPFLKSRSGSLHGYDVVDHRALHPELGTQDDFDAYVDALHAHEMGQIADIVPNHMGVVGNENPWWNDVLENGPSSPYGRYFDIDWRPLKSELRNKVLLPMLGEQYGATLEAGQLQLEFDEQAFYLKYYDIRLPIEPRSYAIILNHRLDDLKARLIPDSEELLELESVLTALDYLPKVTETDPERVAERQREKEVIKRRLGALVRQSEIIAEFIAENVTEFNGDPQNPHSFDLLDELLNAQAYRLSDWKAAADEINYRRFFDINELAALSMEEPDVFRDAHRFLFEMLVRSQIQGLRIDHIDGLYDPAQYLWRLQWGYLAVLGRSIWEDQRSTSVPVLATSQVAGKHESAVRPDETVKDESAELPEWDDVESEVLGKVWPRLGGPHPLSVFPFAPGELSKEVEPGEASAWSRGALPVYVVVEKILEHNEDLPGEWPVAGTTGYDFLNVAGSLFVDPLGLREMTRHYHRFTGDRTTLRETIYRSKLLVLRVAMASEMQLLAARLNRLSEQHRRYRDFTLINLRNVLREIIACFPVYRTYITKAPVSERDRKFIQQAVACAKRINPAVGVAVFDFVRDTLLLEQPPNLDKRSQLVRQFFVGRFQQVTSPVMAKGVEDTAFYRCFPLVSLNEVGGSPAEPPATPGDFHRDNLQRLAQRPGSLLCSTSHDTKRSEDVRARIHVLSEIPGQWRTAVARWARYNRSLRTMVYDHAAPSRNDEYLFYQTLVGIWPIEPPDHAQRQALIERMQGYMQKAIHEAKVHTSWINPDSEYDEAVRRFVAAALEDTSSNRFINDFVQFHARIVDCGLYTALAQLMLKMGAPGVPDIYQGQEIWDFSLVDPDNRRPIDFDLRDHLLREIQQAAHDGKLRSLAGQLGRYPNDLRCKLLVTWRMLEFRRRREAMLRDGTYRPLTVAGEKSDHLCAFAWQGPQSDRKPQEFAIIVAPRLLGALMLHAEDGEHPPRPLGPDVWGDTTIDAGELFVARLQNDFTGQIVEAREGKLRVAEVLSEFPVALLEGTLPQPG